MWKLKELSPICVPAFYLLILYRFSPFLFLPHSLSLFNSLLEWALVQLKNEMGHSWGHPELSWGRARIQEGERAALALGAHRHSWAPAATDVPPAALGVSLAKGQPAPSRWCKSGVGLFEPTALHPCKRRERDQAVPSLPNRTRMSLACLNDLMPGSWRLVLAEWPLHWAWMSMCVHMRARSVCRWPWDHYRGDVKYWYICIFNMYIYIYTPVCGLTFIYRYVATGWCCKKKKKGKKLYRIICSLSTCVCWDCRCMGGTWSRN